MASAVSHGSLGVSAKQQFGQQREYHSSYDLGTLSRKYKQRRRPRPSTALFQQVRCFAGGDPSEEELDNSDFLNFDGSLDDDADWLGDSPDDSDGQGQYDDGENDDIFKQRMDRKQQFADKKGRGWDDTWEIPEILSSTLTLEDLPEWTPECVSPTSRERVKLFPEKIPTIAQLARMPLPEQVHPHPGHGFPRAYAFQRDRALSERVAKAVRTKAAPKLDYIQSLTTYEDKQNAVDELFETVEFELKEQEEILGRHPKFGGWVETALEAYLVEVEQESREILYNQVAEILNEKVKPIVERIATLESFEDKHQATEALFALVTEKETATAIVKSTPKDHPLFSFWMLKSLDEFLTKEKQEATKILDEKVEAIVRAEVESNPSHLKFDTLTGKERRKVLFETSAVVNEKLTKHKLDTKRFYLTKWLRKSFKEHLYQQVASAVWAKLATVDSDANGLDELVQLIRLQLEKEEFPLVNHDNFRQWTIRAVEEHKSGDKEKEPIGPYPSEEEMVHLPYSFVMNSLIRVSKESRGVDDSLEEESVQYPTEDEDKEAVPIFMDVFDENQASEDENAVPSILYPLEYRERQTKEGRMMEEWELAARKDSKRIMLRQSMRKVAQVLDGCETTPKRVLMYGRHGVGKTAAMAGLVATARKSGHIVMYVPDANQLHKFGYYIEPSEVTEGMWNLPILSQQLLERLLHVNEDDLKQFSVDRDFIEKFFTDSQMEEFPEDMKRMDLSELCTIAQQSTIISGGCYDIVLDVLMTQEERPFDIFIDEFNIFYKQGEYFHMDYDIDVKKPIPYFEINLFKPWMDAMALTIEDDGEKILTPKLMKKGAIVAATSEMHPVPKKAHATFIENAKRSLVEHPNNFVMVEVPRLSQIEVLHTLANYEDIGLGRLRLDSGYVVNTPLEVEYLRVMSSSVAQHLMNCCIQLD
eukprot:CAMPEP_0172453632 /NCGR_PEP_ID=MMETSP1065-20121228/10858_1 /TAXON_ID=265537 /ORGANISM="Amphiprora paludosa, Strain CCMP125" /LENGTH=928 /DNA_ID=CAMNT_0013205819 /DNA_START=149 /DNA_END=2935 /DNA_ORIENTATION=-